MCKSLADCEEEASGEELSSVNEDVGGRSLSLVLMFGIGTLGGGLAECLIRYLTGRRDWDGGIAH